MLIALAITLFVVSGMLAFLKPGLGFIAGIVLSVAMFVSGAVSEQMEIFAAAPFVFFAVLMITAFGPSREGSRWARIWARRILIACFLILFTIAAFAFFGTWGGIGLVFVELFIGAVIGAFKTSEFARSSYVITTIGASMRQNLPLPMALEMAAVGQDYKRAEILRNIKKWLVEGYSLSESLRRGYPKCPGYIVSMVAAGERIGQVPQAIVALEQDLVAKANTSKKVRHVPLLYPPLVLFVIFIQVLLMMVFVLPKVRAVLTEMGDGTQLPLATRSLMTISEFFTKSSGSGLILVLALLVLVCGTVYIRVRSRPRRAEKPYLISRAGDFLKWHLPFIRWYEWCCAMQRIAGMLRLSLNAGCTVNEAIANALRLDINECFRREVKNWLAMVERGDDIGLSARQCGMGNAMAWAFADVHNHRNTLDILETLETSYRWGYSRLATLARFIIGPCETICLGLMVGFIVYAVFSPIIAIIYATASSMTP
ncbi:MAG: type II secretion system F family protein [Sedimentisphaerales bacterium]|jgi:general secretion pathway protein F